MDYKIEFHDKYFFSLFLFVTIISDLDLTLYCSRKKKKKKWYLPLEIVAIGEGGLFFRILLARECSVALYIFWRSKSIINFHLKKMEVEETAFSQSDDSVDGRRSGS